MQSGRYGLICKTVSVVPAFVVTLNIQRVDVIHMMMMMKITGMIIIFYLFNRKIIYSWQELACTYIQTQQNKSIFSKVRNIDELFYSWISRNIYLTNLFIKTPAKKTRFVISDKLIPYIL